MARRLKRRRGQGEGTVDLLPSGRYRARYRDGQGAQRSAPTTFDTRQDADAWLAGRGAQEVEENRADPTLQDYAGVWLASRDLKPRTRSEYRTLLNSHVLPTLGGVRLSRLTTAQVRAWHGSLDPGTPTRRAHAYTLLRTMLTSAVEDEHIAVNPARIRGAGQAKTRHDPRPATLPELEAIVAAMPPRYRAMTLLAAWCGLRFGELTELRRADLDGGQVRVERGVVRVDGGYLVGDPKSKAGRRVVSIPPHLLPVVEAHLTEHVGPSADALVFPARHGGHMAPASLYRVWYPAREAAGRPDLRWHDLRHTGATLAAATGATLADLKARIGHSTDSAAMRYQHATQDRDRAIADALSGFAASGVVRLRPR